MIEPGSPRVALITAGAYVGAELAAEFGRLPPAFLPVGNRRLYEHQIRELADGFDRIILSVPWDFHLDSYDFRRLETANVEIVNVPGGLNLCASILHVIAEAALEDCPLAILHGDTLVYDIDTTVPDAVSVSDASDSYEWAGAELSDGRITRVFDVPQGSDYTGPIISGFFHFADLNLLILSLAASQGRFDRALDRYARRRPLQPLSSSRWLDFGHLHTYYISRGMVTTERAFNALHVADRSVVKRSSKTDRMEAESGWYENVPPALRIFLPQYLGARGDGTAKEYGLEFLYMSSLADLFVFGLLTESTWLRVFASTRDFLTMAARHPASDDIADEVMSMYLPKTLARLEDFGRENGIDIRQGWTINGVRTPGLIAIAEESAGWISAPEPEHLTVIHGDPCFSNVLYDFRSQSIRVIDPRGQGADGKPTIYGDRRYDLAKQHHSAIGLYDYIVAGHVQVEQPGSDRLTIAFPRTVGVTAVQSAFERVILPPDHADRRSVEAISLHLFLSMLPLHNDSAARQTALMANALRLYATLKAKEAGA